MTVASGYAPFLALRVYEFAEPINSPIQHFSSEQEKKHNYLSDKDISWHLWHGGRLPMAQGHLAYSSAYGEG